MRTNEEKMLGELLDTSLLSTGVFLALCLTL